ncbi:MAG TPA: methionine aminotransferase [Arachidicoccus soli]|uniref:Aminotransferase class I/II-fold pyridoxal phosphate-dependent enzyme n=1 Tax=Arachidicoccus soli TaxID=2341117 RepID=A0A386HM97_9BACT|nr:methionine aminotransferase [Arachidicoccus soli]AYD46749.1 aminotransferase class I/II-fold pyridoxal phosphate-dependent enzyme [Arachidicoccus soli]HEU0226275.1 methionine aminotransferase [Arachidicoccus soli]
MIEFISKLPQIGSTIFTEMTQLAQQFNAINLGQGFPDYPMDTTLIELLNKAMKDGHNQYAHSNGLPLLRERIAEKVKILYNADINADTQITITPGGTYAIFTALTTILRAGDEVIVFEPAYDCYIPTIEMNGAIPICIALQFPDYQISWEEVRSRISSHTRMIIINTPHNPTGSILSESDMQQLIALTRDTKILILSDEVYEHLIYDDKIHQSVLRYPELMERSFACFSFGKTYHCTGWKLGYCLASPFLTNEFRKVHQYNCFSTFAPAQVAIANYMDNKDAYFSLSKLMQHKRDYFVELLKDTPLQPLKANGSFFQCFSYATISEENEKDFAIRLTKEYGVTAIPLAVFYKKATNNQVLRFCFAKKESTLAEAAERLKHLR